jgi:hypothetical protein
VASPPGTYVVTASDQLGEATVTINYDPASPSKQLRNVGSPARCLVAENTMTHPVTYYVRTPAGTLTGDLPTGHTDATVNQITAQSGITGLANLQMGLGPLPG